MIDQFGEDHPHLARGRDRQGGTGAAVAWMVSNCLTESNRCRVLEVGGGEEECLNLCTSREGFVETLRQYVEVDVFGSCYQDSQQCDKESAGDCWDLLASRCMVQSFILSSYHAPPAGTSSTSPWRTPCAPIMSPRSSGSRCGETSSLLCSVPDSKEYILTSLPFSGPRRCELLRHRSPQILHRHRGPGIQREAQIAGGAPPAPGGG